MAFAPKVWQDSPSTATPVSASGLEDLEARVTNIGWGGVTVQTGASYNAFAGDVVYANPASGGITVHLPTAAQSTTVAVSAGTHISGTNQITVAYASASIYGLGVNGVSSFTVSTPGLGFSLVSDGTLWYAVIGNPNGVTGSGATVLASSPALTNNPTCPTQSAGDSSTKLANTAFVANATSGQVIPPLAKAMGWATYNFEPQSATTTRATTSQTVYAMAVPLVSGQVITNILMALSTSAVGTAPTGVFVGLADNTGKMLAQSNNINSNAIWTTASIANTAIELPLSAPYTVPSSGLYYVIFLRNGNWLSTTPAFYVSTTTITFINSKFNSTPLTATGGTGVTSLPANGSTLTLTAGGFAYWVGAD